MNGSKGNTKTSLTLLRPHTVAHRMNFQPIAPTSTSTPVVLFSNTCVVCSFAFMLFFFLCKRMCSSLKQKRHAAVCVRHLCLWAIVSFLSSSCTVLLLWSVTIWELLDLPHSGESQQIIHNGITFWENENRHLFLPHSPKEYYSCDTNIGES